MKILSAVACIIVAIITAFSGTPEVYSGEIILNTDGKDTLDTSKLVYYTDHPSGVKTFFIENFDMKELPQDEAFEIKTLCDEFRNDVGSAYTKYHAKRFEVTGVVKTVGPDVHNKPSIELSDAETGECYALCIFPSDDIYDKVSVGDTVTVKANFLVMTNWYGVVMKHSKLVEV